MNKPTIPLSIVMLLVLSFTPNIAKALAIDFYGIEVEVQEKIQTKLTATLDSKVDQFTLPIGKTGGEIKLKKASINKGTVNCRSVIVDENYRVNCVIQDPSEGRNTIVLELESANQMVSSGDKNILINNYEFPLETKGLSISYKFPERAVLSEDPPQNSISPRNGDIKTDGKRIFIFWNKQNITAGDILTFSASYTLPIQRESPVNTFLILPIIIILAAFVWFVIKHKKTTKTVGETAAVSVLSQDEKALFDILKAHEGKVGQKVLVRESNFSKAKVSRLLKDLRERGVIEIEPVSGRENRIILKLGQSQGKKEDQKQNTENNQNPNNSNTSTTN